MNKKKSVGRPNIGVTKRISLTLPEETWKKIYFIQKATGRPLSSVIRNLITEQLTTK